jgi:hypothetical protein
MHSIASPRRPPRVSLAPSPPAGRPASLSHRLPSRWDSSSDLLGSTLQTPLSHRLPPRWDSSSDLLESALQTPTAVRSKIREIFMPALSSTMTEGKIVSWIKSEGESAVVVGGGGSQLHHDRGSLPLDLFLRTIGFLNFFLFLLNGFLRFWLVLCFLDFGFVVGCGGGGGGGFWWFWWIPMVFCVSFFCCFVLHCSKHTM